MRILGGLVDGRRTSRACQPKRGTIADWRFHKYKTDLMHEDAPLDARVGALVATPGDSYEFASTAWHLDADHILKAQALEADKVRNMVEL